MSGRAYRPTDNQKVAGTFVTVEGGFVVGTMTFSTSGSVWTQKGSASVLIPHIC
jgi:hypothetical protein